MENDADVVNLWNSIDFELLETLDSIPNCPHWNYLMKKYLYTVQLDSLSGCTKQIKDLLVLMLSLIHTPTVLQSSYKEETKFESSACDFTISYCKNVDSYENGKRLISDLFLNYEQYIDACPSIYKQEPVNFIKALANTLYKYQPNFSDLKSIKGVNVEVCYKMHELYAAICEVSSRYAFIMCETFPLFPSVLTGDSMESVPFLPHFFSFQTIMTPIYQGEKLVYYKSDLDEVKEQQVYDQLREAMTHIHSAQTKILRVFLTSSYVSCDYILNYIATLIKVNRARRVLPIGDLSSDGLMMNLGMCLLEMMDSFLSKQPSLSNAKLFFSYILSDRSRVDYLKEYITPDIGECIVSIMSWLRPMNYLNRSDNDEKWWSLIRAQPSEMDEALDEGLQAKPCSSIFTYIQALKEIGFPVLSSTSVLEWKSLFDYSYNFSLLGKTVSPISPFKEEKQTCSSCLKEIVSMPFYKCLCCRHYHLCASCYENEKKSVISHYSPPFSKEVNDLFASISQEGEKNELDKAHNPLTHYYTEVFHDVRGSFVFNYYTPILALPPALPKWDETGEHCKNYEVWHENDQAHLLLYRNTLCYCNTNTQCKCHGPLSTLFRKKECTSSIPTNIDTGFVYDCSCYNCKSTPLIGMVYQCLHCSLTLCRLCYQQDMEEGKGFPSHQCNHVFILIHHPVAQHYFLKHHRNDMRTIPYAPTIMSNELYMSGVTLDKFLIDPSESNENNLVIELIALLVKLMQVNQTGLFQDYQIYASYTALECTARFRTMQLSVGCMNILYTNFCEHLSYYLLLLLKIYVPRNCSISDKWDLNMFIVSKDFHFSPALNNEVSNSKLCDLVILDVEPSPMFDALSKTLVEVIQFIFEWYMRTTPVYLMKQDLESGALDYTILLLLCCLDENVIPNITTRMDILQTFHVMCTITKERDDVDFIFGYPIIRTLLFTFSIKLYIDSTSFGDTIKVRTVQMKICKILSLLIHSKTCHGEGFIECSQLFEGLGISQDLLPLFIEDLIHQTSNDQDFLNDILNKCLAHPIHSFNTFAATILDNVKGTVNLFVHLINNKIMLQLISSAYLLNRIVHFFLFILSTITSPTYVNHLAAITKLTGMNYNKWLSVVLGEIITLASVAPQFDLKELEQLSMVASCDPDEEFKNPVLISIVNNSFFKMEMMEWIQQYTSFKRAISHRKKEDLKWLILMLQKYKAHFELLNDAITECPEEFLDSLMDTIMQDPVILPSGNRCDRSTIIQQLSISPIDPFTRVPLTIDMVKPDTELKQRIQTYIREKINEVKNSD